MVLEQLLQIRLVREPVHLLVLVYLDMMLQEIREQMVEEKIQVQE